MARYTRSYRPRRSTTRRTVSRRRTSYVARGRRTARRRTVGRRQSVNTIRLVIDTGGHSGASLGPSGMVKPAPRARLAKF